MPPKRKVIEAQLRTLPRKDQVRIAESILATMDPEIERSWLDEAERRLGAYEADRIKAYDGAEVLAELRALVNEKA